MPRNARAYIVMKNGEKIFVKECFDNLQQMYEAKGKVMVVHSERDNLEVIISMNSVEHIGQVF